MSQSLDSPPATITSPSVLAHVEDPPGGGRRRALQLCAEGVAVLLSPILLYFVLRIREMAPLGYADPTLHTAYVVHPNDMVTRYYDWFAASARNREAARVGFLIPARLSYLVFGAVPGFLVLRYLFALVAVVPVYLLLRRLYGPAAGALGIIVVMSCPVIITAWGTDYPTAGVVSYMVGGMASLAMPASERRRRWWLAAASALFAMAAWGLIVAIPLVAVAFACYVVVWAVRDRRRLLLDVVILAGTFVAVTGVLFVLSGVLLGHFDFIRDTIGSVGYLGAQTSIYHSSNWRWLLYYDYLLVPVVALATWAIVSVRRIDTIPTPQLLLGLMCGVQIIVFALLQFASSVWTLQDYYFSGTLWAAVCLLLAMTLAELSRPYLDHQTTWWLRRAVCWLPALLLLAVALAYEGDRHVPAFAWVPWGLLAAAIALVAAGAARLVYRRRRLVLALVAGASAIVLVSGSALVLTVAPVPAHHRLAGVVQNLLPDYAPALGGSASLLVAEYRVATELPTFVGNATHKGQTLLSWWPRSQYGQLEEPAAMFFVINALPASMPRFTKWDRRVMRQRRPTQLLLLSITGDEFPAAVHSLAAYGPVVVRTTVLRSGSYHLHAWLLSVHVG